MKILFSLLLHISIISTAWGASPALHTPPKSNTSKAAPVSTGIMSVYRTLDPAILQSKDESMVNRYVDELNKKVTFYVSETYKEDIAAELSNDRYAILHAGLWIGLWEEGTGQRTTDLTGRGNIGNCLVQALGSITGIGDIVSQYNALMNSSGWNGAWRFIKGIVRRAAGWFGAVYAIYELGDCMNWW